MKDQGCSVLLKGIQVVQHYLKTFPNKYILLLAAESHTGFVPAFKKKHYSSLREIKPDET
ncbi:hypothetical protein B1F79_02615 [Coxiella-like endosymbiont of Rhipicephalus sanguineus]|nr:hypothetical protein [Coxiella-like endosymbiont of Rhipicephalus sanguineus]